MIKWRKYVFISMKYHFIKDIDFIEDIDFMEEI